MKAPKFEKDEDPQVGLMNLMKNLYEEGDDEMKVCFHETLALISLVGKYLSRKFFFLSKYFNFVLFAPQKTCFLMITKYRCRVCLKYLILFVTKCL